MGANSEDRAVYGVGLRPLDSWDSDFEIHEEHGNRLSVCCVLYCASTGLCDELFVRLIGYDVGTSTTRTRPEQGCSTTKKIYGKLLAGLITLNKRISNRILRRR
jgi:hypothetical protein